LILCTTTAVFAQSTDATVSGLVLDPSGRAIPDAEILILNDATGVRYPSATNKEGLYTVSILPPGQYRVQVSKGGFKTIIKPGVILNIEGAVVLNFTLPLGAASETVTVDAGASQINTTDASVSTVIDRKFVENIPLNGRSFQSLILLTPGVVTNSPQGSVNSGSGSGGEFSVNGQRTESNVYTVDGVNADTGGSAYGFGTSGTSGSLPTATALGTTQSIVSVDALQEFRVASSSYSAEYGSSPGGQFSFTTRSGTNFAHGTAFDYLRNNYFDANNWFNDHLGEPPTALRQNDFGGTLGGPVWIPYLYNGRDKSFFFFSYEGLRLDQPQAAETLYVPSLSLRQTAPAALQPVLDALPVPNGPDLSNGLATFVQSNSSPGTLDSTSLRFDHQIRSKWAAFFRLSDSQSAIQSRYLSNVTSTHQSSFGNTLGITAQLSEQIANEFRLNYASSTGTEAETVDNFGGAQPVNLLQLQGLSSPTALAVVELLFPGYYPYVLQTSTVQPQHAWNIVDSTAVTHGRQAIKFGLYYREIASRLQSSSPYVYSFFDSAQSVVQNTPYFSGINVSARSYPEYTNAAIYLQDEIRANPHFGISLGMRWEVSPPPGQTSGTLPYTVAGDLANPSGLSLAPAGTPFWKTTYFNLAPRVGVAYQIRSHPGWETVLRTGGGVFFDSGQQSSTLAFGNSPGQAASASYANASYPLTPAQLNVTIPAVPVAPYPTAYYFPSRLQLPYTLQWNVSLEQGLGKVQTATISYVGSNGRRLLSQKLFSPGAANENFDDVYIEATGTTSNYQALEVKFQRALSRGLQLLASYNWAHSIDYGSQNFDFSQIRGNSDFDVRQSASLATSYDIEAGSSNRLVQKFVQQWGIDGRFSDRTAFPVTFDGNTIVYPNGQAAYTGLDLVSGEPIYIHASGIPGNRQVNPAAFSLPAAGQDGNAPRNFVRGFGATQLDMAVRRTFPITNEVRLQFRGEAFNILNHPIFGYVYPYYGTSQFGQATATLNQSIRNLNSLYQQGGPRSMQFSLKLLF
jgi:hypothetical protein